ncbi:YdbL family protein [Thiolapillus sp.]
MWKKLSWPVMSLLLGACVTINIYFPAAAAEEAARVIVRDVLDTGGEQPQDTESENSKNKNDQTRIELPGRVLLLLGRLMEASVPAAHAAGADININTPAISRLRTSMHKRQQALAPFYRSGAIGFDENGLVAVRDLKAVALKDRNRVKKLVADENRDRNALYREIARANGHPEWEADIRKTFSRIWIEEAPGGYWYKKGGSWKKK